MLAEAEPTDSNVYRLPGSQNAELAAAKQEQYVGACLDLMRRGERLPDRVMVAIAVYLGLDTGD
jgi:hypothetical protein